MAYKQKWGFSSMGAPEMTLAELTRLAADYDCPNIELRTLDGSVDIPSVLEANFESPEEAYRTAAGHGVRIVSLNSSFKLTDAGDEARTELEKFARWAEHLQTPFIRVFGGGKWGEPVAEENWKQAVANLEWWRKSKRENGWNSRLALETHDAFSGSTQCLQLFEKLNTPLRVIWDTHHTWKLANESPAETWEKLGEHVCHVHIKDSVSQPSDRHPYTYVHLGLGEFPSRDVIKILTDAAYEGVISLEWEKLWHPYLDPLEIALSKMREFRARGPGS